MTVIKFKASAERLKQRLILRLPEEASRQLSSRSQVAVNLKFKQQDFLVVLEPDGELGHWLNVTKPMQQAGIEPGKSVRLEITQTKTWPEVTVPKDLDQALKAASPKVQAKWSDITTMARWEWVRWVSSTNNPDTRSGRIEKTISKLNGQHRRPCCFNLSACTDMELAKNGRLMSESVWSLNDLS